jgi:RNA-directed DNA polymerase
MTIKAFDSKFEHDDLEVLGQALESKTYRLKPVRRVYIPAADGTQRTLEYLP